MEKEKNESLNIETNSVTDINPEENNSLNETEKKSDFKAAVIKSVALILCAVLVIFTISSCFNKSIKSNQTVIDKLSGSEKEDDPFAELFAEDENVPETADVADTAADAGAPVETADAPIASDGQSAAQAPAADSGASAQSSSGKSGSAAQAGSAAKAPSTKAEWLNYFNTAINKVKPEAKSITQTLEKNYQAKSINLGALGMAQGLVDSLIENNMGENPEKTGKTATTLEEKNKLFPVENETWSSKLTLDDIKDIKFAEKGDYYYINITVKDDAPASTITHGQSHHAKAFSVVMPQTIQDNAGGAKTFLKDLKVGNSDGKITVKIEKATGHVTYASYDFVWTLGVSSFGGITAYFGIIQNFDIKW